MQCNNMNLFQCRKLNDNLKEIFMGMIREKETGVNEYVKRQMKDMTGTICTVHSRLFVYVIKQ